MVGSATAGGNDQRTIVSRDLFERRVDAFARFAGERTRLVVSRGGSAQDAPVVPAR
jgi:hypothetical protein